MNCFWLHEGVAPNRIVNLQALRDFIATQQALEEPDVIQTHPASEDELCSAWEAFQSHRRREALILSPLQPGTVLSWSGSSLFPSVTDSAIDAGEARQPTTTEDPDRQSTGQATGQQAIEQMNKRICVPLLRRGNDDQVGPPSDTSIRLSGVLGVLPFVRPIFKYSYEGDNLYGFSTNRMQVWVGEVYQEGRNMGQKVVLKLYDERVLAPKMKGAALGTGERSDAYGMEDGYTLAWNEAAAYSKMSPLQGSIVPYSYGHYYVRSSALIEVERHAG